MRSLTARAQQSGVFEEEVLALAGEYDEARFTPAERVAIRFTDRLTSDMSNMDDALMDELLTHFSEQEVIELASRIALANYMNRMSAGLMVAPTSYEPK